MIERPIRVAQSTPGLAHVIVSTDDDEIAELALGLGARVHGRRPANLAADDTPTAPVIAYEVERYCEGNEPPTFLVVMYPSSIFIDSVDLNRMIRRLSNAEYPAQMVMTVTKYPAPIERAWLQGEQDLGVVANPSTRNQQSQAFQEHYYDVGQAYVSTPSAWRSISEGRTLPTALHILPPWKSLDINTPEDFELAEILLPHSTGKEQSVHAGETTPPGTERASKR